MRGVEDRVSVTHARACLLAKRNRHISLRPHRSRRIRAKVYEWAVNSYRDLRDGTAKQDRQSQACGLLERACVDDLSPESQRYMNTMIDLQKSMVRGLIVDGT